MATRAEVDEKNGDSEEEARVRRDTRLQRHTNQAAAQANVVSGSRMIFFCIAYCTNWALLWMSSLRIKLNL